MSPSRAQGRKRGAEVVLRRGPLERHALSGVLLERCAEGGHRLLEALRAVLPRAQSRKRVAEVVLRRGPLERHTLASTFLERCAVGGHRLLEALRAALPLAQGRKRVAECDVQGGTVVNSTDCGPVEQIGKLFRGVPQSFLQHPTTYLGVRESGHGRQRHSGELGAEVIVEIRAKCHVFQLVGLVPATERACARARHEPQAQCLSGLFDQTGDRQIAVPVFQHRASAFLHGWAPFVPGTGSRHETGRADQRDALNVREGAFDGSRIVPAAIVLQPTQDDPEAVFGAWWVAPPKVLKSEPCLLRRWKKLIEKPPQPSRDHSCGHTYDEVAERIHLRSSMGPLVSVILTEDYWVIAERLSERFDRAQWFSPTCGRPARGPGRRRP